MLTIFDPYMRATAFLANLRCNLRFSSVSRSTWSSAAHLSQLSSFLKKSIIKYFIIEDVYQADWMYQINSKWIWMLSCIYLLNSQLILSGTLYDQVRYIDSINTDSPRLLSFKHWCYSTNGINHLRIFKS